MPTPAIAAAPQSGSPIQRTVVSRTILYFLTFCLLGMVKSSLGPTLPDLEKQTGSTVSEISILFTARAIGNLFGAVVVGRLYDRFRGHTLIAIELVLMAVGLAAVPVIPSLWLVTAVMLLIGVGEHSLDVGSNTLLLWTHGQKSGPILNGMHLFFGVGSFLVPLVVDQSRSLTGGITWAFLALAIPLVPVALLILRLPSPREPLEGELGGPHKVDALLLGLITIFFMLCIAAQVSYGGWIFSYALARGFGDETIAALLNSAFWGALTIGRLLAIPIATKVKAGTMLLADLIGSLVSIGLILLFPHSKVAVWVGTVGAGLSMASVAATVYSFTRERMPIRGKVTGFLLTGTSIGIMTLPWIIGQLFESVGPQVLMQGLMLTLALAVAVFIAIELRSRRSAVV